MKWQEYLVAVDSYRRGLKKTENLYKNLIAKYGETREFTNGMGEYLFHHNPSHGRSYKEAKPWLVRTKELDPNN